MLRKIALWILWTILRVAYFECDSCHYVLPKLQIGYLVSNRYPICVHCMTHVNDH